MELTDIWFLLIAVLWTGYFVLEGFDFGVGTLLPVVGKTDTDRRVAINTIGPVWDGNEVWLLVAGGATFAAFPEWYASLFSGFYLALLLILIALIVRGVAFEYRGKFDSPRWRRNWDIAITASSALPALLWGVAFANIVHGVPLDADHEYTGTLLTLLNPYALLGGVATLALFTFHGAVFLALKTTGEVRDRARHVVPAVGGTAVVAGGAFLAWTLLDKGVMWTAVSAAVAAVGLLAGLALTLRGRDGWAFTATAVAIIGVTVTLFGSLYPNVLPSTIDPAFSLTTANAASTPYTLTIMTWVAVIMTPIVLAYQAWTFWVFRKRIGRADIPPSGGLPPLARTTESTTGSAGTAGPATTPTTP
ncbi:cytochrome bd-I ubiquinol oxidase subunit 2 apoprotein [Pseudonocardia thermophila]|jgi:cytochrome d oxidase, subunit II (cydB)|uniref:Cytochrome bd-I ubiquinol oxidase subunit 2 apoprotein n=1 Tax=Pseudonocardia thermophila TaxID=1848 RepID=A0A1M6UZY0_PSETH|nr:cytochrome d ubiquinol oxidase subunit II [Pseudonocardia thermophila]SHK74763.1 cytochrome bd-I ubiquinol oxidase subunit 2 apoprotein [Pseudonocardia thermophila]